LAICDQTDDTTDRLPREPAAFALAQMLVAFCVGMFGTDQIVGGLQVDDAELGAEPEEVEA